MNFDEWWDEDYDDKDNPFEKDSFGYWAYAGWCAAMQVEKREWVGLTDEEIHKIIDDCTPNEAELEELNDFAKAIFAVEAKLKERNT